MNLKKYRMLGTLLCREPKHRLITDYQHGREVQWLMGEEMTHWRQLARKLDTSGVPTALTGGFAGLEYKPLSDALSGVSFVNGNFAPFTATTYTPVFANAANERGPVHFSLYWAAAVTGAASAGTLQLTPNLYTASSTATNVLGASQPSGTLLASGTGLMTVRFELTIRGTGSGTDGRAYGVGNWSGRLTTAGGYVAGSATATDLTNLLGGTVTTFDSTLSNGLWMTCTGTAANATITTQQLVWASWN